MAQARPDDAPARGFGSRLVLAGLCAGLAFVPAIFLPSLYDDFTAPKQSTLLIAAAIVLLGLALDGFPLPADRTVRWGSAAWLCALVVAWGSGWDPVGTLTGHYQYRQGLLSDLAYLVLFFGALRVAPLRHDRLLAAAGIAGLAVAAGYTAVQAAGRDPFSWWTDTADRAIGTVGNANELAAYAVIAVAFGGLAHPRGRQALALATVVSIIAFFVVLESESRSGLLAFGLLAVTFPVASFVAGASPAVARRLAAWTACVAIAALLMLLATGTAGLLGRIEGVKDAGEGGKSTRVALWRGTLSTVAARPILGVGPGALPLAFPRFRPADLGGEFERVDLVVQSSHCWPLDVAAGTGLTGILALACLLGAAGWASTRGTRARPEGHGTTALCWAAVAAYGLMVLLNPLSLSAHAVFWIIGGLLAGRAVPQAPRLLPRAAAVIVAAPIAAGAAAVAALIVVADLRADAAWDDFAVGDFVPSSEGYEAASRLAPWERQYQSAQTEVWAWEYLIHPGPTPLERLLEVTQRIDRRFGLTADDALDRAIALAFSGRPPEEVDRAAAEALRLNPHGLFIAEEVEAVRKAARQGGSLGFDEHHRRIIAVPDEPPP